jgi:phage shock protein PspC (stress-responsive transcriptional regulator)
MKWVRAKDGMLFGVCKGLARTFDVPVGLFRLAWLLSILFLGAGLGLYLLLAICLPREDKTVEALDARLLGVCAKIALRTDVEVGVVRFLATALLLLSFGACVVGYIVLYFVMDDQPRRQSSDRSAVTPPATM